MKRVYTIDSMQSMPCKLLHPVNKSLKNTPKSIEIACKEVLDQFGLPLTVSITKYIDRGWEKRRKQIRIAQRSVNSGRDFSL